MLKINSLSCLVLFFSSCLLISQVANAGDGIRCKNRLVTVGSSKAEVLLKCGEPLLKEAIAVTEESHFRTESQPLISAPAITADVEIIEKESVTETVDQWTYNFGRGTFLKMMVFKGGRLVAINDGPRVD